MKNGDSGHKDKDDRYTVTTRQKMARNLKEICSAELLVKKASFLSFMELRNKQRYRILN
jgi:hypothetical protein